MDPFTWPFESFCLGTLARTYINLSLRIDDLSLHEIPLQLTTNLTDMTSYGTLIGTGGLFLHSPIAHLSHNTYQRPSRVTRAYAPGLSRHDSICPGDMYSGYNDGMVSP